MAGHRKVNYLIISFNIHSPNKFFESENFWLFTTSVPGALALASGVGSGVRGGTP